MGLVELLIGLAAAILAATLLSAASPCVLSRYWYRVLFIVGIGVLLALCGDVTKFGIGGYPLHSALAFAANTVVSWTLAGLAMALPMRVPGAAGGGT